MTNNDNPVKDGSGESVMAQAENVEDNYQIDFVIRPNPTLGQDDEADLLHSRNNVGGYMNNDLNTQN